MILKERIRKVVKEEYPGEANWAGFTRWWLAAEGYDYRANPQLVKFVDGASDGGIDAVALPLEDIAKDTIFVVQSKFYSKSPTKEDVKRFVDAVRAIRGTKTDYLEWLSTCRDPLHSVYDKVRDARKRCRFVITTPCNIDSRLTRQLRKNRIEVCDARSLTSLVKTYAAGRTPRLDSLVLKTHIPPRVISENPRVRVHIFTVKVNELSRAYRRHGDVLFSGNIRYALRGQTPKRVREGIDETLTKSPDEFVFSHNGVTMVGRKLSRRNGTVKIRTPSIVNGAQTVSYFGQPRVSLKASKSTACVMVRLIEVKRDEKLEGVETSVAYRSNNQNKVDPSDLMVDLPALVSLQRYFLRHNLLLERKKGEPKPHFCETRIAKERLAQVLAAAETYKQAVAAKRKQDLFSSQAKHLFEAYDLDRDARLEAVFWTRVHFALIDTVSSSTKKSRKRRAQLAQLAAVTAFAMAMRALGLRRRLMRAVQAWDSEGELASEFLRKSLVEVLMHLLRYSARDKKNEPAFYKAQQSVKAATDYAARRAKRNMKRYFREAFVY